MLSLSIHHFDIVENVLGFGKRLVVWTAGCPFMCDGCIEEPLQNKNNGTLYSVFDLYQKIKNVLPDIDGITFTGGDPLWQSKSLNLFIDTFLQQYDLMLFTGYNDFELNKDQLKCYYQFDLVVEGRFEMNNMGSYLWRGSANQKFVSPTGKYDPILNELMEVDSVGLKVKVEQNKMYFYGIPTQKNEILKIKTHLLKNGIQNHESMH